jgi:hypothetical protein
MSLIFPVGYFRPDWAQFPLERRSFSSAGLHSAPSHFPAMDSVSEEAVSIPIPTPKSFPAEGIF